MNLPLVHHNGVAEVAVREFYSVKSPVFRSTNSVEVDTILGPEMRSTAKSWHFDVLWIGVRQSAAGRRTATTAQRHGFLSVNDRDKKHLTTIGKELSSLGFQLTLPVGRQPHCGPLELKPKACSK